MEDIINRQRLDREAPDWRELELVYRPHYEEISQPNSSLWEKAQETLLLTTAISAVVAALVFLIEGEFLFYVGLGLGFYAGIIALVQKKSVLKAIYLMGGGLLAGLLMQLIATFITVYFLKCFLSFASVVLLFWICRNIVRHHFYWLLAEPRLSEEYRAERVTWWESRSEARDAIKEMKKIARSASKSDESAKERIREVKAFNRGAFFWGLVALTLAVAPFIPISGLSQVIVLIVPPLLCYLYLVKDSPNRESVRPTLSRVFGAVVSWLFASKDVEGKVPGVFRSPVMPQPLRFRLTILTIAALTIGMLPAVDYFSFPFQIMDLIDGGDYASEIDDEFTEPGDWVQMALDAHYSTENPLYVLSPFFSVIICLSYPIVTFFCGLIVSGGVRLAIVADSIEREVDEGSQTDWEAYVGKLQGSSIEREREHLWLGTHANDDYPVLLDQKILREHAYIVGDSGSGKTALGILPMITQLIQASDASIVVIDLKGDNALFQTARLDAEKAGRAFKYFTNESGCATHTFNPLLKSVTAHLSLAQVCETVLESLNLNHGEGYGRSYFSRVCRHWLKTALKKNPNVESFEELYRDIVTTEGFFETDKDRQDAFELVAVIESLTSFEALNFTPKMDKKILEAGIHMPEVIREGQVVYFWLPAAVEAASVRELAKLALYSLLSSAYNHNRMVAKGEAQARQTYLFIDEFQRIASDNFRIVMEQARSMGVGAILANQSFQDLLRPDTDLRPTIQTNTRLKLCFSAVDLMQQDLLIKSSGEEINLRVTYGERATSATETVVPRVKRNDVIEATDDPFGSIFHVPRGSGYTQFSGYLFPLRSAFSLKLEEYERRQGIPWPAVDENTIIPRQSFDPSELGGAKNRIKTGETIEEGLTPEQEKNLEHWSDRLELLRKELSGE